MRIATHLLISLCVFGCNRSTTSSGLILSAGLFQSPDAKHFLSVNRTQSGIINFTIAPTGSTASVSSGGGFSDAHRWFFHWDLQNRLWTYNSDMGQFEVHEQTQQGAWHIVQVDADSPLLPTVPQPVRDNLPETIRKMLKL